MTQGSDGIGRPKRPDLTDLLRPTADINKRRTTPTLFSQALTASIQQIQGSRARQIETSRGTQPLIEIPQAQAEKNPGDDFRGILHVVLQHEGSGYVYMDGGRESSKMGILQSTARAYGYKGNIRNITRADAEGVYKKIWEESGASKLPYPLSLIHFDTYVNSPAAARKILKNSGGNIDTYLDMRAQRYQRLAELRPQRFAKYLKGWMNRVDHLKEISTEYAKNQTSQPTTGTA